MKKFILYTLISIALIIISLFYIPIQIYDSYPIIISVIATICLGVSLIGVVNKIQTQQLKFPLIIFISISLGIVFYIKYKDDRKRELQEYGIVGEAQAVIGRTIESRKYGTHNQLSIKYEDNNGKTFRHTIDIPDLNKISSNVKIPIIYSSLHPQIIAPLLSDEDILTYTNKVPQPIELSDLKQIASIKSKDSINNYLKQKSILWSNSENLIPSDPQCWKYTGAEEYIIIQDSLIVLKSENEALITAYEKELVDNGFINIGEESAVIENHTESKTSLQDLTVFQNNQILVRVYSKGKYLIELQMSNSRIDPNVKPFRVYYANYTLLIPTDYLITLNKQ